MMAFAGQPKCSWTAREPQKLTGVTQERMSRMEREMANLQDQYKIDEQTYGQDILNLVLDRGYLETPGKQAVSTLPQTVPTRGVGGI
jgi:hypothetical protein